MCRSDAPQSIRVHRFLSLGFALVALVGTGVARDAGHTDFTVVAYNLENLFDVDGFALYDDYLQDEANDPYAYTRHKLLTKLVNARRVLAQFNSGAGPEIILFQEFEADFSAEGSALTDAAFLQTYAHTTVEAMLTDAWQPAYADISAIHWLLKALADVGMTGYQVAHSSAQSVSNEIAHTNAVFSKYPILAAKSHALHRARALLEVEIDVAGHTLVVFNNHWKSGASNRRLETVRVRNAQELRRLLEARFAANPEADVLIGGDLNSHYNHSRLFPKLRTGINDVLGAQGDETFATADLYNFWYELPPEERYSEVWRGRRGSLMHIIASPGLYDSNGISYIDGSFDRCLLPGVNADAIGRPLRWNFAGQSGGGSSDHFPIFARFSTRPFTATGELSREKEVPSVALPLVATGHPALGELEDGAFLSELNEADYGDYVGRLYRVKATLVQLRPLQIRLGAVIWSAYAVDKEMLGPAGLPSYLATNEGRVELAVKLTIYRGRKQLMIEAIL